MIFITEILCYMVKIVSHMNSDTYGIVNVFKEEGSFVAKFG